MNSLENNEFYNSLLTSYRKRYNEATHKCYTICLPINQSYDSHVINDKFISAHILKDSPLLKGHFVAANNKHNFDVEIDGQLLKVTRGFGDQNYETIKILSEEIAYNGQNKEYRLFICENPLINSINRKLNYISKNSMIEKTSLITFDDCRIFLRKLSVDLSDSLKLRVNKLMSHYIVLPNYIEDAANRIKPIIDSGIENFKNLNLPEVAKNDLYLESAIESYVIGLTDPKLLKAINSRYEREDKFLYNKFVELNNRDINPVEFGAQKAFESFTINDIIIEELSQIEKKTTPLEKLFCLRKTLDLVSDQMTNSVKRKYFPLGGKTDPICIMSDDLIATVICVLTAVKPKRFESQINFIQTFSWNLPQNNEFGYSLVTFEVVKEFIKTYNFNENNSDKCSKSEAKKEDNRDLQSSHSTSFSPFDRELEKISKMIDKSNISSDSNNCKTNKTNEDLGEFLGSLSQNSFSVGFGKQF